MLLYSIRTNADVQKNMEKPTNTEPLPGRRNPLSGLGARIRARFNRRGTYIVNAAPRNRNGFCDFRRMCSSLGVTFRIGFVLFPSLVLSRMVSLLSSRRRNTTQNLGTNQTNTSNGPAQVNTSPSSDADGSKKAKKSVQFSEGPYERFEYEPEPPNTQEDTEEASSSEEESSPSISRKPEEENYSHTHTSYSRRLSKEDGNARVAASKVMANFYNGKGRFIPKPDLGKGVYSVPGTNLLLQKNLEYQEVQVFNFLAGLYPWLLKEDASYRNRPGSLEELTKGDCTGLLENRDLLLQTIPRIYNMSNVKGSVSAVLEDPTGGVSNSRVLSVELGPEGSNKDELSFHGHASRSARSLQSEEGGSPYRVLDNPSNSSSGFLRFFRRKVPSTSLEEQLLSLSSTQLKSVQQQVLDTQKALTFLPISGWGMKLRFILPPKGDRATEPRVALADFNHSVLSSEADFSLRADEAMSKQLLAQARANLHAGLEGVVTAVLNI